MLDPPIRVVVADAQPLFALGIRTLLSAEPTMHVVGEASDGVQALQVAIRTQPDVLLFDLSLERSDGLEVLSELTPLKLATRTVVMTTAIDRTVLRSALLRGARGVLLKHCAGDLLIKCVRQVTRGEYWIGRDNVADLVDALRKSAMPDETSSSLTQREKEIVNAVLKGASNKDIAWQLGLGEQTIKNHLRRIFTKLHVANRVELAMHAMGHQFTNPGGADLRSTRGEVLEEFNTSAALSKTRGLLS